MFINHVLEDIAYLLLTNDVFHSRPRGDNLFTILMITYLHGNVGTGLAQGFDSVKGVNWAS